jgi:hypothetical protein
MSLAPLDLSHASELIETLSMRHILLQILLFFPIQHRSLFIDLCGCFMNFLDHL